MTLGRRNPTSSESVQSCDKVVKSGLGEVKNLGSITPTLFYYKDFNYDDCTLTEVIKDFTSHDQFT